MLWLVMEIHHLIPNLAITSNTGQRITINNPIADNVSVFRLHSKNGRGILHGRLLPISKNRPLERRI